MDAGEGEEGAGISQAEGNELVHRFCPPTQSVFVDPNQGEHVHFRFANNSGCRCPPELPSADQWAPPAVERRISWRPGRAKGDTHELGVPAEPVRGWHVFYNSSTISHNDMKRKAHPRMISFASTLTHPGRVSQDSASPLTSLIEI